MNSDTILIEKCASHYDEMVKMLESVVNIDSKVDNPPGSAEVAHIFGEKLEKLGFDIEYRAGGDLPTHLYGIRKCGKEGAKTVLFMGHMDTVFDKGTAAERPFRIDGEKAYGPGVADMKSGITSALFALQSLYETGWDDMDIICFFAGDEECGHPETDFKEQLMEIAKKVDFVFNFETGMDSGDMVVQRRGVLYPLLTVNGIAAHAGKDPDKGASAIKEIAYKISRLYELDDKERGINFNAGKIYGGIVDNGIAGFAQCECDFRFDDSKDAPYILEKLQEVAAEVHVPKTKTTITVDDTRTFLPMEVVDGTMELFVLIQKQAAKIGREVNPVKVGSGADSCWTTYVGTPTICAMGGRGGLNHSDKEYLFIDSLKDRSQIIALTLKNYDL